MALRGGMSRRVPGNPMASILRDIDRRTRTTTRRARPARPQAEQEDTPAPPAETIRPAVPVPDVTAAAVVVTGPDGRARWTYPRPTTGPRVVTASPVILAPNEGLALVVLEAMTATYVQLRVWCAPSASGSAFQPAGAGIQVHVIASSAAS